MALTLECICSPDASICTLTQALWRFDSFVTQVGSIGAFTSLTLHDVDGLFQTVTEPHGRFVFDLNLNRFVTNFGSLAVTFFMDQSLFQKPDPPYSQYQEWLIVNGSAFEMKYQCTNLVTGAVTHYSVKTGAINSTGYAECKTGEIIRGYVNGATGGTFYYSSPLGDCFSGGISGTDDTFFPAPTENYVSIGDSSQICLCATGGSGSYSYSIVSGELPCGITLDQVTGCLEGEADGTCPGTTSVTFRVTDNGGAAGTGTGGVTIGGTCRAFGSGATRITGGAWTSDMAGNPITIAGSVFTVATVTPPGLMTVTGTIGIIDPTTWTYTSPVVAPPAPGPPETAEVTCGFISKCPSSDTGLGGNSAY